MLFDVELKGPGQCAEVGGAGRCATSLPGPLCSSYEGECCSDSKNHTRVIVPTPPFLKGGAGFFLTGTERGGLKFFS